MTATTTKSSTATGTEARNGCKMKKTSNPMNSMLAWKRNPAALMFPNALRRNSSSPPASQKGAKEGQ